MIKWVKKRNGLTVRFQKRKLKESLQKAFSHLHKGQNKLEHIAQEISEKIEKTGQENVEVHEIRKMVIRELNSRKMHEAVDHYELVFLHLPESKLKNVLKRNGKIQEFDPKKIYKSVRKAFSQARTEDELLCEKITSEAIKKLQERFQQKTIPIESIREIIEETLTHHKLKKIAIAYALHKFM